MRLLLLIPFLFSVSLYSLSFTDSQGNNQALSAYSGKKILFVNIASGSRFAPQLRDLEQLRAQHADSLVVLAFPSNSFGHEPLSDSTIRTLCTTTYGAQYLIAQKAPVTGSEVQAAYGWLTQQSQNGDWNQAVLGDFQKFLVSESGRIVAVFAPSVSPLAPEVQAAIQQQYP